MENHRSRGAYDSNGAIQEADQDEGTRIQRLLSLQLEALGSTRRHAITTQGYKEDLKEETSSLSVIERARRVNKSGTVESHITNNVKAGLNGWSSAWMQLEHDGTAESSLDTMNDGQTHRAKLMSDPSVRDYKEDSGFLTGSSRGRFGGTLNRPRGGGRGGRGGGQIGNRPGRHGPARVPAGMPSLSSVEEEQELSRRKGRGTFQFSSPGKGFHSTQGQVQNLKASNPMKTVPAKHAKPDKNLASPGKSMSARPNSGSTEADLIASTKFERRVPPSNGVDRPSLAAPNTFMAAAKRMFKIPSTRKVESTPLALKQSVSTVKPVQPAANLPPRETLSETAASPKVTSSTHRLSITSPPNLAAQNDALRKPEAMARDAKSTSNPNHKTAVMPSTTTDPVVPSPTEKVISGEVELPSAVAQFLANYGSAMPSGMLLNLQGYLVGQAISNDPKSANVTAFKKADASTTKTKDAVAKQSTIAAEANSVDASAKPKIVIKLPQLVGANANSTGTQPPTAKAPSTSVVNKASSQLLQVRQEIHSLPATPKAPVPTRTLRSNEPIALEARLVQSSASLPSPVVRIKGDGRARAVIFGEHVFKDRYSIDDDDIASPVNSTVDAQSPISAALIHLSLREQHRPNPSVGAPARAVNTDIKPINFPPAVPVKHTQQGVARSLLTAAETPNLIGSAVERPSPPRYATENPFVQPLLREMSRAASRATPIAEAFVQPVLEGRSRTSSRATSTEVPRLDSLSGTERYATTPYSWNEDTKRAPSGDGLKPQLPAFLQGLQPSKDPAAAARAQYGGIVSAGSKYTRKENQPPGKEQDPMQSAQARGYRYTGL